jgi:hypothetical protein
MRDERRGDGEEGTKGGRGTQTVVLSGPSLVPVRAGLRSTRVVHNFQNRVHLCDLHPCLIPPLPARKPGAQHFPRLLFHDPPGFQWPKPSLSTNLYPHHPARLRWCWTQPTRRSFSDSAVGLPDITADNLSCDLSLFEYDLYRKIRALRSKVKACLLRHSRQVSQLGEM